MLVKAESLKTSPAPNCANRNRKVIPKIKTDRLRTGAMIVLPLYFLSIFKSCEFVLILIALFKP
jgi:hypothetical protein